MLIFVFCSPYNYWMRDLTPVQVLTIILQRLEKRANALEGVRLESFNMTVDELRRFAQMVKSAREYLQSRHVR
jgi:hypothetical protein